MPPQISNRREYSRIRVRTAFTQPTVVLPLLATFLEPEYESWFSKRMWYRNTRVIQINAALA
eukprot:3017566-Rhodomonas_salina.4